MAIWVSIQYSGQRFSEFPTSLSILLITFQIPVYPTPFCNLIVNFPNFQLPSRILIKKLSVFPNVQCHLVFLLIFTECLNFWRNLEKKKIPYFRIPGTKTHYNWKHPRFPKLGHHLAFDFEISESLQSPHIPDSQQGKKHMTSFARGCNSGRG